MSKSKLSEEKIQNILIKKGNWHSGMFPYMTNSQLADVLEVILSKTFYTIIQYKNILGHDTFIDDISRNQIFANIHREIRKRLIGVPTPPNTSLPQFKRQITQRDISEMLHNAIVTGCVQCPHCSYGTLESDYENCPKCNQTNPLRKGGLI